MTIYVTGDTHGGPDLQKIRDWENGKPGDYLIIAGDFGYPWDFSEPENDDIKWLETRPYRILFVDGNHERYDYWRDRPTEEWNGGLVQRLRPHSPIMRLMRGEIYTIEGSTVFTMGGATSTDKQWRHVGEDWWPCELPSEENFEQAREKLDEVGWSVDYVVTHTCATGFLEPTMGRSGDPDRLTDFFQELEKRLEYKHWYYGHFHIDRDVDERHTALYDEIVPIGMGVDEAMGSLL